MRYEAQEGRENKGGGGRERQMCVGEGGRGACCREADKEVVRGGELSGAPGMSGSGAKRQGCAWGGKGGGGEGGR